MEIIYTRDSVELHGNRNIVPIVEPGAPRATIFSHLATTEERDFILYAENANTSIGATEVLNKALILTSNIIEVVEDVYY